jgi:hypothetical protein
MPEPFMERAIYTCAGMTHASLEVRRQKVIDELIAGEGSYPGPETQRGDAVE